MPARLVLAAIIFLTSYSILSADIIITTDNMVLNGKIIKEGTKTVTFANYHGIFIIDRDKIWEIYRTDNYEDDVKILSDKGRVVNADEVKTNNDSGKKKLKIWKLQKRRRNHLQVLTFQLARISFIISGNREQSYHTVTVFH